MKLLWDTHTFLWFVAGSNQISDKARKYIETAESENYISIASLWEISIKTALGKLSIQGKYESVIDDVQNNGIIILPINFVHTVCQNQLPLLHRDPFDRIIVSQAITENMYLISADEIFDEYLKNTSIKRGW
jgi:PIN domain nuclease of toxin-antitoxin system